MTALLMHQVRFDEQEFIRQELFQLEKELIAECLDVANTGKEVHPLGWMMIFWLSFRPLSKAFLSNFLAYMGDV